eukprot:jgi/Psemu1/57120/gm1.57120_g
MEEHGSVLERLGEQMLEPQANGVLHRARLHDLVDEEEAEQSIEGAAGKAMEGNGRVDGGSASSGSKGR